MESNTLSFVKGDMVTVKETYGAFIAGKPYVFDSYLRISGENGISMVECMDGLAQGVYTNNLIPFKPKECPVCQGTKVVAVDPKHFSFKTKPCDECDGTGQIH